MRSVGMPGVWHSKGGPMDPKLAVLFVLIATVVGLSHMSERQGTLQQVSRALKKLRPANRRV